MCSFTISSTLKCVELALLIHCNLSSISLYSESINAGSLERKRQFAKHVSKLNESYLAYFKKSISSDPSAVMIRASQGSCCFVCLITFAHAYIHLSVNPICFFYQHFYDRCLGLLEFFGEQIHEESWSCDDLGKWRLWSVGTWYHTSLSFSLYLTSLQFHPTLYFENGSYIHILLSF